MHKLLDDPYVQAWLWHPSIPNIGSEGKWNKEVGFNQIVSSDCLITLLFYMAGGDQWLALDLMFVFIESSDQEVTA